MYRRLAVISLKLESYSLNPRAVTNEMLQRMSGDPNPAALKILAAVVQPSLGSRKVRGSFNVFTPLNRLVDAVSPESETGRKFNDIAKQIAAGKATAQQLKRAQQWLVLWRDNDAQLRPILGESELTEELLPLSRDLHQVAVIGLQTLADLRNDRAVNEEVRQNNIEILKSAEQPQAALVDMVAPSVELLVQATRTK